MGRVVVLLFGPSGAGKTTIAQASPRRFTIYDRDDPRWRNVGEPGFKRAIASIATNPEAQAIVIRSGPTSAARARTIQLIAATHACLVAPSRTTCHQQAGHRRRGDVRNSHAYIDSWFERFDHDDRMPYWPGSWDLIHETALTTTAQAVQRDSWEW